jgi:chitin synthase
MAHPIFSPVDPSAYGAPFERPASTVSSSTDGAWRRRQTIKRGVTRKVKLTGGNFIAEYAVPTAIRNAVEPKWAATNTTEFTYASCPPDPS